MRAPIRPISPSIIDEPNVTGSIATTHARTPTRRGVSFLEVVLGVALMGAVAGTLSLTVSAVGGSFQRQQTRLAAAEIAGRLLIARVDDEEAPELKRPEITYGDRVFRWSIEERPVTVILSEPAREAASNGETSGNVIDLSKRLIAVTITAWPSEESGGSAVFDPDLPHYTLTRLVDPIAFTTSDSAEVRLGSADRISQYMQGVVGSMTSGDLPTPAANTGGRGGAGTRTGGGNRPAGEPQRGRPTRDGGGG